MNEKLVLKLQRRKPVKPGWPIRGDLTGPDLSLQTLEDPLVLYPSLPTSAFGPYVDGNRTVFKIAGVTAIPAGTYRVYVTHSPTFKRELPILVNVPQFTGVRIHRGNYQEDSEGCIVVGTSGDGRTVSEGAKAEETLIQWLRAHQEDAIWLEVRNP